MIFWPTLVLVLCCALYALYSRQPRHAAAAVALPEHRDSHAVGVAKLEISADRRITQYTVHTPELTLDDAVEIAFRGAWVCAALKDVTWDPVSECNRRSYVVIVTTFIPEELPGTIDELSQLLASGAWQPAGKTQAWWLKYGQLEPASPLVVYKPPDT